MPKISFICPVHGLVHSYETDVYSPNVLAYINSNEWTHCNKCGRPLKRVTAADMSGVGWSFPLDSK